jgi:glycosyltransferase involved in cell wall biosynthesis
MSNNIFQVEEILVDILMPTYNHEKFVVQAIQSVLMQECTFKYRLIIGEDCSTDGTLKICEKYASAHTDKILLLRNSINVGMAANYKLLFDVSAARYIAILEGDDYWIDKQKLQKQIDLLEAHNDVGMIHTNYYALYENGRKKVGHIGDNKTSLSGNVIGPTQIAEININPLTTCFRAFLAKENVDFDFIIKNNLLTVDIFLWAEVCRRTKVLYLDEVTGVYRIHSDSLTASFNIASEEKFNKTSLISVNYIMDKYNTPIDIKEALTSKIKINLIYCYLLANKPDKAKFELQNVNRITTLRDKIICLAAKYRFLNFLAQIISFYYHFGSKLKQFLAGNLFKTNAKSGDSESYLVSGNLQF